VYQWLDFRRDEPHGGLLSFVPGVFRRTNRHFYPKYSESELFLKEELEREQQWKVSQAARSEEIARQIVARLTRQEADE
jgi:hypothetical protein